MTILCYHAVDPDWESALAVRPSAFLAQCAWLSAHRHPMELHDAIPRLLPSGRLPGGGVAVTFDDGFASVYENALQALTRHRVPATVFVVASSLHGGEPADWIVDPPPVPPPTLGPDQVLEMREAGIRFGSHSLRHVDLDALDEADCVADLRQSREILEDLLHEPVRLLAYPRGRHDDRVRRAASLAGFSNAFTLPERREPVGPYSIPRVGVYRRNGIHALRTKTSPWYLSVRNNPAIDRSRSLLAGAAR